MAKKKKKGSNSGDKFLTSVLLLLVTARFFFFLHFCLGHGARHSKLSSVRQDLVSWPHSAGDVQHMTRLITTSTATRVPIIRTSEAGDQPQHKLLEWER